MELGDDARRRTFSETFCDAESCVTGVGDGGGDGGGDSMRFELVGEVIVDAEGDGVEEDFGENEEEDEDDNDEVEEEETEEE